MYPLLCAEAAALPSGRKHRYNRPMPFVSRFSSWAFPLVVTLALLQGTFWMLQWLQHANAASVPANPSAPRAPETMAWVQQWYGATPSSKTASSISLQGANGVVSTIRTQDGRQGVAVLRWGGTTRPVGVGAVLDDEWTVTRIERDEVHLRNPAGKNEVLRK